MWVPANQIKAGFGPFDDEGTFVGPGFFVVEQMPNQSALGTRQRLKRGRRVHRYSDIA